jgi:hypothetical protein
MTKPRGPLTLLRSSRKFRWLVAIAVSLPVLYVASFGPACWVTSRCSIDAGWIFVVYRPIIWVAETAPVLDYFAWYSFLGSADGWAWHVDESGHIVRFGP